MKQNELFWFGFSMGFTVGILLSVLLIKILG